MNILRQENGYDCGGYVIRITYLLAQRLEDRGYDLAHPDPNMWDLNDSQIRPKEDRQIATICSNQAAFTVPLFSYQGDLYGNGIPHKSEIQGMPYSWASFNGYIRLGYVYYAEQGVASLKVFKKNKEHMLGGEKMFTTYLTTANESEANEHGYVSDGSFPFFYSLPLDFKQT